MITIGSLCSGYGGLDLAVEQHFGATTVWVADNNRDASLVLAERFPGATNLGDIQLVDWSQVGRVDVLTAGYPCQPFSSAGRQLGTADKRHLWPHILRAIRTIRPRCVVLENVRNHLAPRMGFGEVLGGLAESGFDADWILLRASDIGAPHNRARVFVLADLVSGEPVRGIPPADPNSTRWKRMEGRRQAGGVAITSASRSRASWGPYQASIARWEAALNRCCPNSLTSEGDLNAEFVEWLMGLPGGWVTDILPNRRAIKVLGNGVVPQQAQLALRMMTSPLGDPNG